MIAAAETQAPRKTGLPDRALRSALDVANAVRLSRSPRILLRSRTTMDYKRYDQKGRKTEASGAGVVFYG